MIQKHDALMDQNDTVPGYECVKELKKSELMGYSHVFTATVIEHECTHNVYRRASASRAFCADRLGRA